MTTTSQVRPGSILGPYLFVGAVIAGGIAGLWTGLWAGSHGRWLPSSNALGSWLRHLDDPQSVAPPGVSIAPPVAYTIAVVVTVGVWIVATIVTVMLQRRRQERSRGLATASDVRSMSARAVRGQAATLRPVAGRAAATSEVGVFLGHRAGRNALWGTIEDSYVVIGPPRSGKTARLVAPTITRWPGPAVATGLRADVIGWTTSRATVGDRFVFDPGSAWRSYDGASPLRWSPLSGCTNDVTALSRATALLSGRGEAIGNDVYWRDEGRKVLCCYLLAAAHGGQTMSDVLAWTSIETSPAPVDMLNTHGLTQWAAVLEQAAGQDPRYRAGVWGQVSQALFPFMLSSVRQCCDLPAGDGFDPARFATASCDTLYLLGNPREQKAVAGLCVALVDAVTETARTAARDTGRLDPPLLVALDEAANVAPLHTLDELLATGGGSGICSMPVFQSIAQARAAFGGDRGDAIVRDLATIKILFGGGGNAKDLRELGELLGERDEETTSVSSRAGTGWLTRDISRSTRLRPVLTPAELRELGRTRRGETLVIPRAGKAARTVMPAVWELDPLTL